MRFDMVSCNTLKMATNVQVGLARLCTMTLKNPDGSVNATATMTAQSGNEAVMVTRVNPSNPREIGVRGVVVGAVNAIVSAPVGPGGATKSAADLITVDAAPQDLSGVEFGAFGPPIAPPAWLL